jgi:23S rRNA pseudouridine1911/1915/1917 synthase
MGTGEFLKFIIPAERAGQRLDIFLADMVLSLSRSRVSSLIRTGNIVVNGKSSKAGYRLKTDEQIEVTIPPPQPMDIVPEHVDFAIIHQDDDLVVIAKPPDIVVHPACGHQKGTLVHGLLARCDNLSGISGTERPGIVHRLDKDTSGVMVVAKNDRTHHALVELFKTRQVKKVYRAIVDGCPVENQGCISRPIGRHRSNRKKMAVLEHGGREAVTRWKVLEKFPQAMTYLEVRPETGRTHQIRVHMSHLGHPIAGDTLYGRSRDKYAKLKISRQCLHAYSLSFKHPTSGEVILFIAPVWPDLAETLELLSCEQ